MYSVGEIINTHGLKGEVKIKVETDFPERFHVGETVYLQAEDMIHPLTITHSRKHKNLQILKFKHYDAIEAIEKWKGRKLYIKASQQEQLPEDEFYYHEIIGCEVYTRDEQYLGEITSILTPGANDVWVVKNQNNEEILIPYIDDVVKDIDLDHKRIKIEVIEGLMDS